jgi:hypothetical protein
MIRRTARLIRFACVAGFGAVISHSAQAALEAGSAFPRPLDSYGPTSGGVLDILHSRVIAEPFNLVATSIFILAIIHTFVAGKFRHWAHTVEEAHRARRAGLKSPQSDEDDDGYPDEVSFGGQILHFLGEVEVVFGIWAVVLMAAITWDKGWPTAVGYVGHHVNFTEAIFVVVIMALASTRPVMLFAEQGLRAIASVGRHSAGAWWLSILIIAPILGSFITEPAAMTIAALLLARRFYALQPSPRFCYATLGLLFVNVSVGGTLTHFAAPPVLMVSAPWGWDMAYMFLHFGWKSVTGIVVASSVYYFFSRREMAALEQRRLAGGREAAENEKNTRPSTPVPFWITGVQLAFMAFTVFVAHYPALFVGAFLFFLGFARATAYHQHRLDLRPPLLVGFFLAGLVIHGGLQAWWIEPVLRSLGPVSLFLGATALTAVNDNAAITYLATLVPGFTEALKQAVVAGAVAGGGLTVIANAPNPAGQAILQRYFPDGVSPWRLFLGALWPTAVMVAVFLLL